jgi:beta-lactamase regulating signal transducer with metallopeptidase domain
VDTFLHFGLANAVVATILALLVAGVCCFCRRPPLAHSLWLLVLLKLLTPPLLTVPLPWPLDSSLPPPPMPKESASAEPRTERTEVVFSPVNTDKEDHFIDLPSEQPLEPSPPSEGGRFQLVVLGLWLTGSLLWWALAGLRLRRFHRLLAQTQQAPPPVQELAQRLAAHLGMRRCPTVWFVPAPVSPMLLALGWSPRLLVPTGLWEQLTGEQRETLLVHELAHQRRGDPWVRRLELFVLGLYWWHPVVWIARRQLQEAEEECCDAWVVWALPNAAQAYAQALVETVTFLSRARVTVPLGASGAGQLSLLKRRLTMILCSPAPRRLSRAGFWGVVGLGLLVLPLLPGGAQTQQPPADMPMGQQESNSKTTWFGRFHTNGDPMVHHVGSADDHVHYKNLIYRADACLSCHQDVPALTNKVEPAEDWKKAHDEVLKRIEEVVANEKRLAEARARLDQAIERMNRAVKPAEFKRYLNVSPPKPVPEKGKEPKPADVKPDPNFKELEAARYRENVYRTLGDRVNPSPEGGSEERLRDLEKKLDQILKEVDTLRRQIRPDKSPPGNAKPR